MNSEIICVGTELLVGDILNTNVKYISEKLAAIGINLYYQTVVGDNHKRLKEVLEAAYKRADLVILTGGLGPTIDDITKEVVAEYHNEKLVKVDKYYDILAKRYKQMNAEVPAGGIKEVSILENSRLLENEVGIAPGFLYEKDNKITIVMPGPPREMTVMLDKEVMPELLKYSNDLIRFRTLKIMGVPEGKVDEDLAEYFVMSNPTVAPYAKTGEVHVRIGAKGENEEELIREIDRIEKGNEVGTVFIGLSIKGEKSIRKYDYSGMRNAIRERAVRAALLELWKLIK